MDNNDLSPVEIEARRLLDNRTKCFRLVFDSPEGKLLLEDLASFCRANESTFTPDPRLSNVLEGRREVWLRIQHHLNLTNDELWELYR